MPFQVPSGSSPEQRQQIYDLFGIGKKGESMWIRRVKGFFTFGLNTTKLTDTYFQTALNGKPSLRGLATEALAANPKWINQTKDLTVLVAVFKELRSAHDFDQIVQLHQAVVTDNVWNTMLGNGKVAEKDEKRLLEVGLVKAVKALDAGKLNKLLNTVSALGIVIDATPAFIKLIRVVVSTEEDLEWGDEVTIAEHEEGITPAVNMDALRKEIESLVGKIKELLVDSSNFTIDYVRVVENFCGSKAKNVDSFFEYYYKGVDWDAATIFAEEGMLSVLVPSMTETKREAFIREFEIAMREYQKENPEITNEIIQNDINEYRASAEKRPEE